MSSTETVQQLRSCWRIDPDSVYLNHGSFGPPPLVVQQAREDWSRRLDQQPMRFFCQQMEEFLDQTTATLADFLHTKPERLALVDNATLAMNIVAESIALSEGDQVLLTDHEYGAVRNIWSRRCQQTGARLQTAELPFPVGDPAAADAVVSAIEARLTAKTRVLVVSHVTSATACILPVRQICRMARERGVLVCIDGPHAVAMLDLFLDDIGCDYYCASCHKWLCAPLGSGFLWVHPQHHGKVRCPIISWGGSIAGRQASWKDRTNWLGTRDPAPLLAISSAIEFFTPARLKLYRQHAHELIGSVRSALLSQPEITSFCNPTDDSFVSMCGFALPKPRDWKPGYHGHPDPLQMALRDRYRIEIPVGSWNDHRFLRVSAHLYTTPDDVQALNSALHDLGVIS